MQDRGEHKVDAKTLKSAVNWMVFRMYRCHYGEKVDLGLKTIERNTVFIQNV
jgi:hypothetical protein